MKIKSFFGSSIIGMLGGLIGLGGAEFRLPFLVGILKIDTLHAIIINLSISLVTVLFALLFRGVDANIVSHSHIVLNLLSGTLIGAYIGVSYATKINKETLHTLIFYLLIFLSLVLFSHTFLEIKNVISLQTLSQAVLGLIAGVGIGLVSSLLGVAGGELLIPTIVLLYGVDIKTAGTLSLAISLPTLLVGLYRYHKNGRFLEILNFRDVLVFMSIGSIVGAFIGAMLFGEVNASIIEILLAVILLISAYKLFKKK